MNLNAENIPEKFEVRPYCAERPVVLNTTPAGSNAGCYRDEQITVLFDKPMDENSIYFTENEIPAGKEKLYATREGNTEKIYAYADPVEEDGITIYKNKIFGSV